MIRTREAGLTCEIIHIYKYADSYLHFTRVELHIRTLVGDGTPSQMLALYPEQTPASQPERPHVAGEPMAARLRAREGVSARVM